MDQIPRKYRYQILVTIETIPVVDNGEKNEPNAFVEISADIDKRIKNALLNCEENQANLADYVKINYCGLLDITRLEAASPAEEN